MRHRAYLRERWRPVLAYTGLIGHLIGLLILCPLALLVPYPEEVHLVPGFLVPGLTLAITAAVVWQRYRPRQLVSHGGLWRWLTDPVAGA